MSSVYSPLVELLFLVLHFSSLERHATQLNGTFFH